MTPFKIPAKPSINKQDKKADARMFSVVPLRAMHDKRLTRGDLIHLIALCSYCSPNGFTFVAHSTIANLRGCSNANVSRGLKKLEKLGYFEQVRKGYTSMRGSLKRVIYDESLDLTEQEARSNISIESLIDKDQENMARAKKVYDNKQVNQATSNSKIVGDTAINFDEGLLVVSQCVKTDSDLLKLENLIANGITKDELIKAFEG